MRLAFETPFSERRIAAWLIWARGFFFFEGFAPKSSKDNASLISNRGVEQRLPS